MNELKAALGAQVNLTVFLKLAELEHRTSHPHRGAFYTLDEITRFDALGPWSFRAVYFSEFGTLVATAEALVATAEVGYDAEAGRLSLSLAPIPLSWGPRMVGRPMPRIGRIKVSDGERVTDQIAIGVLTSIYPPAHVDDVLERAGKVEQRDRLLGASGRVFHPLDVPVVG